MLKLASAFRLPTRAEASKDAKFSEGEEASMLAISNISLLNAFFYLRGKTILRDLGMILSHRRFPVRTRMTTAKSILLFVVVSFLILEPV